MTGALNKSAPLVERQAHTPGRQPGCYICTERGDQGQSDHQRVKLAAQSGLRQGVKDHGGNGNMINKPVGRIQKFRWQKPFPPGQPAKDNDGKNGDNRGRNVH